ncbi:MAG: MBL fold metallo-hydrolase [Candidatus Glassbacteria bacterium]|nr:MBL fold metallo-hydrolase [Candidatus Glassbacteria bacterium]
MRLKFWGVRGSIPTPGPTTVKYGGNTTCMQIIPDDGETFEGEVLIIDAGTGIRELGLELMKLPKPLKINLLITHTHMDHINGFPFFVPAFIPGTTINIYGPLHYEKSLEEIFAGQMDYSYFPISTAQLAAGLNYHELNEGEFEISSLKVRAHYMNHPVLTLGYRITDGTSSILFSGDHEPYFDIMGDDSSEDEDDVKAIVEQQNSRLIDFFNGVDLLVCDAAYTPEEYETHRGWGHSSTDHAVDWAIEAGVKTLVLFHHEPNHSDDKLDEVQEYARKRARDKGSSLEVQTAAEMKIFS